MGVKLASRTRLIEPFQAMEVAKRAALLEADGVDVIRLSLGEPDFPVPSRVLAALRDSVGEASTAGRSTYTPALGVPALRDAIAGWQNDRFGTDIDGSRVVVTAGASAALMLLAAALVEPGDEVLVADPSYPCNRRFIEAFGGHPRLVATTAAERYQPTAATLSAAWSERTAGVMLATPSNPTGTSIAPDELARIGATVAAQGGWRIVDEIYLPLSYGDTPCRSVLAADAEALVVGSFSKYWAMPGWRLGWAIVPQALVPVLERLAQHLYICPSAPAQLAALACFHPDTLAECERRRERLDARRQRVLAGLASAGFTVPAAPDGAFYVYVDASELCATTGLDSAALVARLLAAEHVALTPGLDFGDAGALTHFRLSYAADESDLERALEALARFRATLAG